MLTMFATTVTSSGVRRSSSPRSAPVAAKLSSIAGIAAAVIVR